jgi:ribosomal protein L22
VAQLSHLKDRRKKLDREIRKIRQALKVLKKMSVQEAMQHLTDLEWERTKVQKQIDKLLYI